MSLLMTRIDDSTRLHTGRHFRGDVRYLAEPFSKRMAPLQGRYIRAVATVL
jgi:hypothetical protein